MCSKMYSWGKIYQRWVCWGNNSLPKNVILLSILGINGVKTVHELFKWGMKKQAMDELELDLTASAENVFDFCGIFLVCLEDKNMTNSPHVGFLQIIDN